MRLLWLLLAAVCVCARLGAAKQYTHMEVTYFRANSNCNASAPSPAKPVTYELLKCYSAEMYDCSESSVTYMKYPDLACGSMYPNTYGLPAFRCMSPVYAYSQYDSYIRCY